MKDHEPLTIQERNDLIKRIRSLENYPSSQRLFRELFDEAKRILDEKGERKGLFRKVITYIDATDKISTIAINYIRQGFDMDRLVLGYGAQLEIALGLWRSRGNLSRKRFERMNPVEMATKASDLEEIRKGLFEYEPYTLVVNRDGKVDRPVFYE